MRLNLKSPFVLGMAMGLVLNLSFVPIITAPNSAYAQLGGGDGGGGGFPTCQTALITAEGFVCVDSWYAAQAVVWASLFGGNPAWSPDFGPYDLDVPVLQSGTYTGANHLGDSFELRVYDIEVHRFDDINELLQLAPGEQLEVLERQAIATVVFGDLWTEFGVVPVFGLATAANDDQGIPWYAFQVLARLPDDVGQGLRDKNSEMLAFLAGTNPCFPFPPPCLTACSLQGDPDCGDITCCDSRWRQQFRDNLGQFIDCLKDKVAPFGLRGLLCIFGCLPGFLAGGVGYPTCLAICLGGDVLAGIIDVSTCITSFQFQGAQNKISYCACLQWKCDNCQPIDKEPAARSCP